MLERLLGAFNRVPVGERRVVIDGMPIYERGVVGDDFRVYYYEQRADYVLEQSDANRGTIGSPEAGLTNQQNWDKYGIAFAGEVAPKDAVERAGIRGLVYPTNVP